MSNTRDFRESTFSHIEAISKRISPVWPWSNSECFESCFRFSNILEEKMLLDEDTKVLRSEIFGGSKEREDLDWILLDVSLYCFSMDFMLSMLEWMLFSR